ncbi:hypothetical protein [Halorubrum sp. DTA98]|uniref:hypothetical protein n=1 Tax=Halorubrum sp. DTA98 TaxID=3402163 RepID=UPI003AAD2FE4
MSTTESTGIEAAIDGCRPADVEPIVVNGDDLESTAPGHLRDLKSELSARGYHPATLAIDACFAEDCTLATQAEADRLRGFVRAAAFLGVGRFELRVDEVAEPATVEPALVALAERASREGVELVCVGDAEFGPAA